MTEGTPASFTVTRIGDSAVALTMKLTVDDAANADSMASGNEGSKTVTVTDDTIYNSDTISSATVTANDDDTTTAMLAVFPRRGQTIESPSDIGNEAGCFSVILNRKLYTGESLAIPFQFSGRTLGTDFRLQFVIQNSDVTYNASTGTVTFTSSASGSATNQNCWFVAYDDIDIDNASLIVTIPSLSSGNPPILTATGLGDSASFIVVNEEADPGIIITITSDGGSVVVNEKTGRKRFTVALATRPTADVDGHYQGSQQKQSGVVDASDADTRHTEFGDSATLTSTNWHIPQPLSLVVRT